MSAKSSRRIAVAIGVAVALCAAASSAAVRTDAGGRAPAAAADASPCSQLTGDVPSGSGGPANDDFSAAQEIVGASGTVSGTLVDATVQDLSTPPEEDNSVSGSFDQFAGSGGNATRSVWYCWTVPADGEYHLTTLGSPAPYDGSTSGAVPAVDVASLNGTFDWSSLLAGSWTHISSGIGVSAGGSGGIPGYVDLDLNLSAGQTLLIRVANAPWYTDLGVPDEGGFVLNWGATPFSQTVPVVGGSAVVGETLAAHPADWHGTEPIDITEQWSRCDSGGDNCAPVEGATSPTYVVAAGDVGSTFRVDETARNVVGVASAESNPTPVVAEPAGPPVNQTPPIVSGTAEVGQTLSVTDPGGWAGVRPIDFSYQWRHCFYSGSFACQLIPGAVGTSYVVQRSDANDYISVVVTATNDAGTASAFSDLYANFVPAPPPAPPQNTATPQLIGSPTVGGTFDVAAGNWDVTGDAAYAYQWESCDATGEGCVAVDGATTSTYTTTDGDLGRTVRALVIVTDSIGTTTATTDASPVIRPKPGPVTPPPFTAIDIAPNAASAQVRDVNNRGEAVGTFVDDSGTAHPFAYDADGLHDLSAVAQDFRPIAVNDQGVIIGTSSDGSGAEILDSTGLHLLGTGWTPTDINNLGHASGTDASGRPVYWDGSTLHVIDTRGLPNGQGFEARATGINDSDEVVGWQPSGEFSRADAFVYEGHGGSIRALATGDGYNASYDADQRGRRHRGERQRRYPLRGSVHRHGRRALDPRLPRAPPGVELRGRDQRRGRRGRIRRRRPRPPERGRHRGSLPVAHPVRVAGGDQRLRRDRRRGAGRPERSHPRRSTRTSCSCRRRWPSSRAGCGHAPARASRTGTPSPRPTPASRRSRCSS